MMIAMNIRVKKYILSDNLCCSGIDEKCIKNEVIFESNDLK
jgi:hypothetical protein